MEIKCRSGSLGRGELCRTVLAFDLACRALECPISRGTAVKLSSAPEAVYAASIGTAQRLLGLQRKYTPEEVATEIGDASVGTMATKELRRYQVQRWLLRLSPEGDKLVRWNPICSLLPRMCIHGRPSEYCTAPIQVVSIGSPVGDRQLDPLCFKSHNVFQKSMSGGVFHILLGQGCRIPSTVPFPVYPSLPRVARAWPEAAMQGIQRGTTLAKYGDYVLGSQSAVCTSHITFRSYFRMHRLCLRRRRKSSTMLERTES